MAESNIAHAQPVGISEEHFKQMDYVDPLGNASGAASDVIGEVIPVPKKKALRRKRVRRLKAGETALQLLTEAAEAAGKDMSTVIQDPLNASFGSAEDSASPSRGSPARGVAGGSPLRGEADESPRSGRKKKKKKRKKKAMQKRMPGDPDPPPASRIHVAAALGQTEYVTAWVEKVGRREAKRDWRDKSPPYIDALDTSGRTPLMYSAIEGQYRQTNTLLNNGADPNLKDPEHEWTALHHAAFRGHYAVCERLLRDDRTRVLARDHDGATALMLACGQAQYRAAMELIEDMDDVDDVDMNGWTALHYAAWHGAMDTGMKLLDAGADKDKATNSGMTAADIADAAKQEDFQYMIRGGDMAAY